MLERQAAVATRRQAAAAAGNGDAHRVGRLPVVAEGLLVAVVAVHGSVSGPGEAHDRRGRPACAAAGLTTTGLTTAGRATAREATLTRGPIVPPITGSSTDFPVSLSVSVTVPVTMLFPSIDPPL